MPYGMFSSGWRPISSSLRPWRVSRLANENGTGTVRRCERRSREAASASATISEYKPGAVVGGKSRACVSATQKRVHGR